MIRNASSALAPFWWESWLYLLSPGLPEVRQKTELRVWCLGFRVQNQCPKTQKAVLALSCPRTVPGKAVCVCVCEARRER